jgi:hypothetical protein
MTKEANIKQNPRRKESGKGIKGELVVYSYDKSAFERDSRAFGGLVVLFEDTEPDR